MNKEKIVLRVAGSSMSWEDGYDLNNVIETLKDAQSLINKTYLSLNGRSRYTSNDDEYISLKITEFKKGSLITEMQVMYDTTIMPLVGTVANNPKMFWNVIKGSYDVLKTKMTAKKEGKEVEIVIDNNSDSQINAPVITGNNNVVNITIPAFMQNLPDALQPEFDRISKHASEKGVSSISIGEESVGETGVTDNIKFDISDRDRFEAGSVTTNDMFAISGKIINANYNSLSGTIKITTSGTKLLQVDQEYRFKISDNLFAEEVWKEMFLSDKPYFCKVQYNTNNDKIEMIYITDWDEKNFNEAS